MTLQTALSLHKAGRLVEAARAYQGLLSATAADHKQDRARLHHLLGFALLQLNQTEAAVSVLSQAVALGPGNADAWLHLGASMELRDPIRARGAVRRAVILRPDSGEGTLLLGRLTLTDPISAGRAVLLAPSRAEAWSTLAHRLASDINQRGRVIGALKRALCLNPGGMAEPLALLAQAFRISREVGRAAEIARRSTMVDAADSSGRIELAAACLALHDIATGEHHGRAGAVLSPNRPEPLANLAEFAYRRGAFEMARRLGSRAGASAPTNSAILTNLSAYHLALGDLAGGWRLFDRRPAKQEARRRHAGRRFWDGQTCEAVTILAEQGLGDELMFSTIWPELAALVRDGKVGAIDVEVDPRLVGMARRGFPELSFIARDIERAIGAPVEPADRSEIRADAVLCPAGDLPGLFREKISDFPSDNRPLEPSTAHMSQYGAWVSAQARGRPVIGLAWRSGLLPEDRDKYYPSIGDLEPLLRRDALFVVLQYDDCAEELAIARERFGTDIAVAPDLDLKDDLDGVAALTAQLDAVISGDTAVLALAGRMNVPAIGLVPFRSWAEMGVGYRPFFPSIRIVPRALPPSSVESTVRPGSGAGSDSDAGSELWVEAARRGAVILDDILRRKGDRK
jgi:Flp pilus assembly protein TadD